MPNQKFWTFFLLIEYWNITYIFTLILSTIKRKMILSGNYAFPTMLQSVAWLSFSVFDGSLKIENWKLQSIYNFCFSAKTFKIVDRTTQEGGGGIHSHGNSRPKRPPLRSPSPHANFFFFAPAPLPPLPRYASLERKKREIRITAQSLFQHERLQYWVHKGSCNNSKKKQTPRWAYCWKKDFPTRKALVRGQLESFVLRMG